MSTARGIQQALELAALLARQLAELTDERDQLRAERENQIDDIKRTQSELRAQLVAFKCSEPDTRVDELTARVRELEQERDRALADRSQAIAANSTIADGYNDLRRELEATKAERDQLKDMLEDVRELNRGHGRKIDELVAQRDRLQRELDELRGLYAGVQLERDQLARQVELYEVDLRATQAERDAEAQARVGRVAELEQERDELLEHVEKLKSSATACRVRELEQVLADTRHSAESAYVARDILKAERDAITAERNQLWDAKRSLQVELERRTKDNTHLRRELSEALDQVRCITDKLAGSQDARRQLSVDRDELYAGREEARKERDEYEAERDALKIEVERLTGELKKLMCEQHNEQVGKLRQQVAQLSETKESHLRTIASYKTELDEVRRKRDEYAHELGELRHSLKSKGEPA